MSQEPVPIPPPPSIADDERLLPGIVYALYLIGIVNGLTLLIGLILAYVKRPDASPAMRSHYEFQIRSAWIGLAACLAAAVIFVIGIPLTLVLIGILFIKLALGLWALIGIWFVVRCVLGLMYLSRGEAYPRPEALLI